MVKTARSSGFFFMDWKEIEALQQIGIEKILSDKQLKKKYLSIQKNFFNTDLCHECNSAIKHSYIHFKSLTPNQMKTIEERQFALKTNTVLWVEARQSHITNANITDEIAVALLRKNKGYQKYFEKMPQGWENMLSAPLVQKQPVPVVSVKESVKEPVKEVATKKQVKEAIVESIKSMTFSELKEYAGEREEQFFEWKKNKSKAKLVEYILSNL